MKKLELIKKIERMITYLLCREIDPFVYSVQGTQQQQRQQLKTPT